MAKLNRDKAFALAGSREVADVPKEFAAGANQFLASALGGLDRSIIGDIARIVKGKPTKSDVEMALLHPNVSQEEKERIANEYLNADTFLQQGQGALNEGTKYWLDKRSPRAKAQDEYVGEGDGFVDTLGRYAENPSAIAGQTIRNLPQLAPMLLLKNAPVTVQATLGNVYQGKVGAQQAVEQSLEDSKDQKATDRYLAAETAGNIGGGISQAAGTIGLRGDTAMLNLLAGNGVKGLTTGSLKEAGKHLALNIAEETVDEAGSPIGANIGANKTYDPTRDITKDVGKQAAAGAVIGAGMGSVQAGGLYLFGNTTPKKDLPNQYQNAFNTHEDAKQAFAQAEEAYNAQQTPETEESYAQAEANYLKTKATFEQTEQAFKTTFTEQEQQDLLANSLKGIAARAKLAQEEAAAKVTAQQQAQAQQEAIAKAQRENLVNSMLPYADDPVSLNEAVGALNLDATQEEQLLNEVFAAKKANTQPTQAKSAQKTPLELAVDDHFDAKGNLNPKAMSSDIAAKHKVPLVELLPAIAQRIKDNEANAVKAKQQAQTLDDQKAYDQEQARLAKEAERKAKQQQIEREKGFKLDQTTEQQQLENTLADFAANNDTDSMMSLLEGYDQKEADKLFNNAFKTVETRAKEAEKAVKAKEAETAKQTQAKQKQSAFNADMSALYESNPNATYSDWKAVGRKHGVTSAIDLANAWASAAKKPKTEPKEILSLPAPKDEVFVTDAKGRIKSKNPEVTLPRGLQVNLTNVENTQRDRGTGSYVGGANSVAQTTEPAKPLALPAPNNVMVTDAQGNTTKTTENNVPKKQRNADISVPSGLNVDVSNAANTQRDRGVGSYSGSASNLIVRQDGKPFPTEQVAQQALTNKTTKKTKAKKNEPVISKDTHTVVPVDGGFAIAKKEEVINTDSNTEKLKSLESSIDRLQNEIEKNAALAESIHSNYYQPSNQYPKGWISADYEQQYYNILNQNNSLKSERSKLVGQYGELKQNTPVVKTQAQIDADALREKTKQREADVTSSTYERAQKRLQKEVNDWQSGNGRSYSAVGIPQANNIDTEQQATDDITGQYTHSQFHDATATVTKTDKGYDVDWGDEVQSFTGKNALEKTKSILAKEGFNKGKPKDDGDGGVMAGQTPNKPVSPTNTTQTTPTTTGAQIAQAMDKTAKAITEAAHNKVVERVKNGEEIVYKQPTAIERVQQDDRYQVEINDKGHAVVKNVKDANGEWVKKNDIAEAAHIENGKAEEVTPEIIRESLAKVDDKPIKGLTMSVKQGKQWLLDQVTTAIAIAPKTLNKAAKEAIEIVNTFSKVEENKTSKIELEKARKLLEPLYITFDVPNDGKFKVLNTVESLEKFKKKVQTNRGFDKQSPVKPFPAPSQNSPETTISNFLADGELENAYFFAENQKKPIRFTLSNKKEPIAYFLTEPVDLGNNITGFVGISTVPMSKSKRWLVIEEKSRTSIGFEEISKQAAIKSAKARLSSLKKEDLESLASKIIPISKTDEEMKADWLKQNNIVIEDAKPTNKESAEQENQSNTSAIEPKQYQPSLSDVVQHLESKKVLVTDWWKDSQTRAKVKSTLEDYLDEVVSSNVSPSEFKKIRDSFFDRVISDLGEVIVDFSKHKTVKEQLDAWLALEGGETLLSHRGHKIGFVMTAPKDFKTPRGAKVKKADGTIEQVSIVTIVGDAGIATLLDERIANEKQAKNEKKLIGKNTEGNNVYEDANGIRFVDNGTGFLVGESVDINLGNKEKPYDTSARTDEHRTVEEVNARVKPSKTDSLIIKIDDELDSALDDLANIFKGIGKGTLNTGVDPVVLGKVLAIGTKASALYLAKGAVKFAAWAKNMIDGLSSKGVPQSVVEPYLKQLYLASKVTASPEIRKNMDKEDDVFDFDFATLNERKKDESKPFVLPIGWDGVNSISTKKGIDGGIIDKAIKTDKNKPDEWFVIPNNDNLTSQFKGKFFSTQKEAFDAFEAAVSKTKKQSLSDFLAQKISQGEMPNDNRQLKSLYLDYAGIDSKEFGGLEQKQAQEALELAIVQASRVIIDRNKNGIASTYNELVELYNNQPNLNTRTSTSIANQAYSTPAPLAYIAAKMAGIDKDTLVYEPTAGNGMLLITALPENITANELNKERFDNLKSSIPNANLANGNALTAIKDNVVSEKSQDAVITNPPFGSLDSKTIFDGYKIGKIDHLITLESLKTIKDDGTAAIIIGADKVAGLNSSDDVIFLNYLYSNYNVISHFEVDGSLYSRQGASWPVRVIIVNGRKKSNKTAPINGTIKRVNSWGDIYEQYKLLDAIDNRGLSDVSSSQNNSNQNDTADLSGGISAKIGFLNQSGRESARNTNDVSGTSTRNVSDSTKSKPKSNRSNIGTSNEVRPDQRTNAQDNLAIGDNRDSGKSKGNESNLQRTKPDGVTGNSALALTSEDNQFQVKYTPASSRKDEGVLIPVNMRTPLMDAMDRLIDNVGDIDQYVSKELGYDSVEEMQNKLMGLQVDSIASAIYQIKEKGKGIIIADQTGIGKGRQAASIIRFAERKGYIPVFITVKPQLFTDMYYDLDDIGSKNIKPFIFNDQNGEVVLKDGTRLFKTKPNQRAALLDSLATGEMPKDTNAVFLTYSQINKLNRQQMALSGISSNAIFILDESHNAGGMSATGLFMQDVLANSAGVVYLSATYAKRPDNMPVYFKTDMGLSADESSDIAEAMSLGGLPLQTVISNMLVKSGQLFRRERSYDGVSIETFTDTKNKAIHKRISDQITGALRAIVKADSMFHSNYEKIAKDLAQAQGMDVKSAGNKASDSVTHTEFSAIVHNFIRQLLLGLKVDEAANQAISALKQGKKPLIAVENTMGSFLNEYAIKNTISEGDSLADFGYKTVLKRALDRTRFVTIKDEKGQETKIEVPLHLLDSLTRQFYDNAESIINKADLDGIPASPIDWMRYRITQAGYSVSEITGRKLAVDYSKETPVLSKVPLHEQNDKVGTTRLFNDGSLDAIILNVSGSTGISLHASEKFKDQRPRHMIIAQPAQDINIFMQMLGRIHRTGQVVLPSYTILSLDLPTEKRPTAVLNKKMRSLNANTSSNTDSATSIKAVDMLNKYGDKIFAEFLYENKDIAKAIGIDISDIKPEQNVDLAKKASGRMALLPIDMQQKIYDELEPQYSALITYLNETNQNELEPKAIDFEAELLKEQTIVAEVDKSTPFGGEAVLGTYKVKPQGEPMTIEQIKALAVKNIGEGVSGSAHAKTLIEQNKPYFDAYLETFKPKTKDAEDIADAEANRAKQAYAADQTQSMLNNYRVGTGWIIDIKGELYNSVITNVKTTYKKGGAGNPFSPSKWIVSLAVNGSLRSVTLPLTEFNRISQGYLHGDLAKLMQKRPDDSSSVKIITGNLLAAYTKLKDADARVITFTKKDGSTEQGILLPKSFKFEANIRQDLPLKESNDVIAVLNSNIPDLDRFGISTRKHDLTVFRKGDKYIIRTPKSKATGGKWYLNKNLLDAVGDFASQDKTMSVTVGKDKIKPALDAILQRSPLYVLPSMAEDANEVLGIKPIIAYNTTVDKEQSNAEKLNSNAEKLNSNAEKLNSNAEKPTNVAEKPKDFFKLDQTVHAIKNIKLFVASMGSRIYSSEYTKLNELAKKHNGYYSAYTKNGAIAGFQFENAEDRAAFVEEAYKQRDNGNVKFSKSSTIGDRTVTQVREKLISRFGKRIIEQLESKGILKIHQSMKTLPKGVLDMARGTEDAAYYNGVVHLIADNLTDENIIPAFVHDLSGHKGFQEMMSPKAYELIMQQFYRLVAQGNAIAIKAKQRAERAEVLTDKEKVGKTDKQIKELEAIYRMRQQDEYIPYLLTEQEKAQFATPQERNAVKRLIDHIVRAVKGWVVRTLSKYNATAGIGKRVSETLDARDIQLMAERMIRDIAKYSGDNNRPKFSRAEQSQFDQLLAKADKMIAEQGKLLAPNGKPSKLNRFQWAQVRTDNFKQWFGDWEGDAANASKVVDENGEPLVVYHGTNSKFTIFELNKLSKNTGNDGHYGSGFYFSIEQDEAKTYGYNVISAFINIKNPIRNSSEALEPFAKQFGYKKEFKTVDKQWFADEIAKKDRNAGILAKLYADGYSFDNVWDEFVNRGGQYQGEINLDDISDVYENIDNSISYYDKQFIENTVGNIPDNKKIYNYEKEPNILDITDRGNNGQWFTGIVSEAGHDGVIAGSEFVAFSPTQIKSAIGNNGDFDPTNPDIRFSRGTPKTKAQKAVDYVLDSVRYRENVKTKLETGQIVAQAELGRLAKTLHTQYDTASKHADYKKVYDLGQDYLAHIYADSTDALEAAPNLLQKLDDWQDLKRHGKAIHKLWKNYKDRQAAGDVIWAETLAKKPLPDGELLQKLTDSQLLYYREARDAIEVSLKRTAISEMIRGGLLAEAMTWGEVKGLLNKEMSYQESKAEIDLLIANNLNQQKQLLAQAVDKKAENKINKTIAALEEAKKVVADIDAKLNLLLNQGYAPLMRFGHYTLRVTDRDTGEDKAFFMLESKAEQNRLLNQLADDYGDVLKYEKGTMNEGRFKLFNGVTPESIALFAKESGLSKVEGYQDYIKLVVPSTSALSRRIRRKGMAGFNDNLQRVVASFVMSNARFSAKNIYKSKINDAVADIESGDVQAQAQKMTEAIFEPTETYQTLKTVAFIYNLAMSLRFALVNLLQPIQQTLPFLTQYVGVRGGANLLWQGMKMSGKAMFDGAPPSKYTKEYHMAVRKGVVDPQNAYMLMGLERGGTGMQSSVWSSTKYMLGLFAQVTESFNRKATFFAALELANKKGEAWVKAKGFESAYDFAVDAVGQTQGVQNKGNRPNWSNTAIGAPLMIYKQFSINYIEQFNRMRRNHNADEQGKKAAILMIAILFSLAGGLGLPFAKNIIDVVETSAATAGSPVNLEREVRLALGDEVASPLLDGVVNHFIAGGLFNADIQGTLSMGNMIPSTGLLNPVVRNDSKSALKEGLAFFGVAGGLGDKAFDTISYLQKGDYNSAAIAASPRFIESWRKGYEMLTTGEIEDRKGRRLFDATTSEGVAKFLDFQPRRMAELNRTRGMEFKDIAIQRYKTDEFRSDWVRAAQKEDFNEIENIEQDIEQWNEGNPLYPVLFDRQRAWKAANKNEMTWGDRQDIPKGLEWFEEERPDWIQE
jgi:hypothetical protein